jgi:hypothetical protein
VATWKVARGLGLKAARLTGDCNPVHWSGVYARRLGFAGGSFLHPQVAIAQCLAYLSAPSPGPPFNLDTWIRGQVYVEDPSQDDGRRERGALHDRHERARLPGKVQPVHDRLVDLEDGRGEDPSAEPRADYAPTLQSAEKLAESGQGSPPRAGSGSYLPESGAPRRLGSHVLPHFRATGGMSFNPPSWG